MKCFQDVQQVRNSLADLGFIIFLFEPVSPDGHFAIAVGVDLIASIDQAGEARPGERAAVARSERREVGWGLAQAKDQRSVAAAIFTVTWSAIEIEGRFRRFGRWRQRRFIFVLCGCARGA